MKTKDYIGKRFGRLEVIALADRPYYVVCKCDCGKIHTLRASSLTRKDRPVMSCGCLRSEMAKDTAKEKFADYYEELAKYGTSVERMLSSKPNKNSSTGHKGVSFYGKQNKYVAYITFRGKRYSLGSYDRLGDAVKAREAAEDELYTPILEELTAAV